MIDADLLGMLWALSGRKYPLRYPITASYNNYAPMIVSSYGCVMDAALNAAIRRQMEEIKHKTYEHLFFGEWEKEHYDG